MTIDRRHVLISDRSQSNEGHQKGNKNGEPWHLSSKSRSAIDRVLGKNSPKALLWGYSILHAGARNAIDPNLLVGLAARESGLNPNAKKGLARGMFQITPRRASDLGIPESDLSNPNVVTNAVAASLAKATKSFKGNIDFAIASWTVGLTGTRAEFEAHGMEGVRNLLLDAKHPSYGRVGVGYVDAIKSYLGQ